MMGKPFDPIVRMLLTLALLLAFAVIGCKERRADSDAGTMPKVPERPRLVSDAELATLEGELMSAVRQYRVATCPRPVLRGSPKSGVADSLIVSVIEAGPAHKACLQRLSKDADALSKALYLPKEKLPRGWPKRNRSTARPLDDPAADLSAFAELQKSCAPLIEKLRAATQYGQVCSPYLPGRRGLPRFIVQLRLMKLIALQARQLLKVGKAREALELLLDAMRFNQDLARGDASLISAMISVAATGLLTPYLELALNSDKPLPEALLSQLERELALLSKSEEHPLSFLRGDHRGLLLTMVLPRLKGPGWTPPGGWGADPPPKERKPTNALGLKSIPSGFDPKDEWGLLWLAAKANMADWRRACQPEKAPIECYRGLAVLAARSHKTSSPGLKSLLGMITAKTPREQLSRIREQMIAILRMISAPAYQRYIERHGFVRFQLTALRTHAAFRALSDRQKSCPDAAAFEREPLKALRINPYDNRPLLVRASEGKHFILTPGTPLRPADPTSKGLAWVIRCSR